MPNYLKHYIHVNPPGNELHALYIARTMRAVAMGMIGIFIPIYLLDAGYDFTQVIIFMMGMDIVRYLVTKPAGILMSKIGVEKVFVLSFIASIFSFISLAYAEGSWPMFFAAHIFSGLALGSFWPVNHYIFMIGHNSKRAGRQTSGLLIATRIGVSIGPLLGGLIATNLGFDYVFVAAIVVMLGAIAPFIYLIKHRHYGKPVYDEKILKKYNILPHRISMFAHGYEAAAANYAWPFFIYLFVDSYQTIGLIVSISLLLALAVAYIAGSLSDKGKTKKELDFGSAAISGTDVTRSIVDSVTTAFGVNTLNNVLYGLLIVPFSHNFYNHADRLRLSYIIAVDKESALGHVALWITIGLLAIFLPIKIAIIIAFLIAAAAVLVMRYMARPLVLKKQK